MGNDFSQMEIDGVEDESRAQFGNPSNNSERESNDDIRCDGSAVSVMNKDEMMIDIDISGNDISVENMVPTAISDNAEDSHKDSENKENSSTQAGKDNDCNKDSRHYRLMETNCDGLGTMLLPPPCAVTTLKKIYEYMVDAKSRLDWTEMNCDNNETTHQTGDINTKESDMPYSGKELQMFMDGQLNLLEKQLHEENQKNASDAFNSLREQMRIIQFNDEGKEGDNEIRNHINNLMSKVSALLQILQPLDLEKVCNLLEKNSGVGDEIEGKDIIFLMGWTGSGKTTTLHFLAGSTFSEVQVGGFGHLRVDDTAHPRLASYLTSSETRSVTRTLQCFEMESREGTRITVCDSPGFADADEIEVNIANGWGLVQAISRAKTVKPVLVLSRDGIGDRFCGISDILSTVTKLFNVFDEGSESVFLNALSYIFTKYPDKYKNRLCKQLGRKRKQLTEQEKSNKTFILLIEDIIKKTSPTANIILPLEDDPEVLLHQLVNEIRIEDPKTTFRPFVDPKSQLQLEQQLHLTEQQVEDALHRMDIDIVSYKLQLLSCIGKSLPIAKEFFSRGLEKVNRSVRDKRCRTCTLLRNCLEQQNHERAFQRDLQAAKNAIEDLLYLEPLSNSWLTNEKSSVTLCVREIECLTSNLCQIIVNTNRNKMTVPDLTLQTDDIINALNRLKEVSDALSVFNDRRFVGIHEAYEKSCLIIQALVAQHIQEAENLVETLIVPPYSVDLIKLLASEDKFLHFILNAIVHNKHCIGTQDFEKRRSRMLQKLEDSITSTATCLKSKLEPNSSGPLSKSTDINPEITCDYKNLLTALMNESDFVEQLSTLSRDSIKLNIQLLEGGIIAYIKNLVSSCQHMLEAQKREENAAIDTLLIHMTHTDNILSRFRKFSSTVWEETDTDYRKLVMLSHSVEVEMRREQNAVERAQNLLSQMESNGVATNLSALAAAWEEWTKLTTENIDKSKWEAFLRTFRLTGERESVKHESLKKITSQCGDLVRANLLRCCNNLNHLSQIEHDAAGYFTNALMDVRMVIEFLQLDMAGTSLAKWVLLGSNSKLSNKGLHHAYLNAQSCLVQLFSSYNTTISDFMDQHRFRLLNKLLNNMVESAEFWSCMKNFASGALFEQDLHKSLQRNILNCEEYSVICDKLCLSLTEMQKKTCEVTFLHEEQLTSLNEHDRMKFYKEVARCFNATAEVNSIDKHVDLKVSNMRELAMKRLERETQQVGNYIFVLLRTFPSTEEDAKKINIWYGNLSSIGKTFHEAAPVIAGLSYRLREEADSLLHNQLDTLLNKFVETSNSKEFVDLLLLLKKISMKVVFWREKISNFIDKLLLETAERSSNNGRFLLDVSLQLNKIEGESIAAAKQILSEHSCFKGAMNAVFNNATARQGIEYVINGIDVPSNMQAVLKDMYTNFSKEYKTIVTDGLKASIEKDTNIIQEFFANLVRQAKDIAEDYSLDYQTQLTDLLAHIFAYWSLNSMDDFVFTDFDEKLHDDRQNNGPIVLMKPHAAQVVAIWMLLSYEEEGYLNLRNHLVQVMTGEGKSIVLGVTAIVLAMMKCDVECICYSSYLSGRDFTAFKTMFKDFHVSDFINYGTIEELCEKVVNEGGDLRDLTKNFVMNKHNHNQDIAKSCSNCKRMKVLLIDEVDVFFKHDFYGETYDPGAFLKHPQISEMAKFIWKKKKSLTPASLLQSTQAQDCISLFAGDFQHLVSKEIKKMLCDANSPHNYIVSKGEVAYKYMDGLTRNTFYGYKTMFAYMKEYEKGSITEKTMLNQLYVQISCGNVSFAEIPVMFDVVLGVTGTLKMLSTEEQQILSEEYNIKKFSYAPSVYGNNKLIFAGDNERDVVLCNTKPDYFLEIRNAINIRRKPQGEGRTLRAVMVFFATSEMLLEFYESEYMQDLKSIARTITEEICPFEKEGAFLQATVAGAITLMIKEYGRGTDFKCFDSKMLDSGGVHVLQTFFSTEISEEVQIKGRTARQGNNGSFSMVLNASDLQSEFGITSDDIQMMKSTSKLYSFLHEKRLKFYANQCNNRKKKVEEAETCHYETMEYKDALINGRRIDAINFLFKQHGLKLTTDSTNCHHQSKNDFLRKKQEQNIKFQNEEQARRKSAQEPEKVRFRLLKNSENENYYELLGVSQRATEREINRAFRSMARKYHPDKCKHPGIEVFFQKLNEAKEVLLSPLKRAEYDKKLNDTNS